MNREINFIFPEGSKLLKMPIFSKTYIHLNNDHRVRAVKYDSPAPWLNNAVGNHPKPFSFIQTYCDTCKEKHGIIYLNRFDQVTGQSEDVELTEKQAHEEVEKFINNRDI